MAILMTDEMIRKIFEDRKPVKTFKATKEEIADSKEGTKIELEIQALINKLKSKRTIFWAKVSDRLGVYDGHLKFNVKTNEIEQYEEIEELIKD